MIFLQKIKYGSLILILILIFFSHINAQSDQQFYINATGQTDGNCSMVFEGKEITGIITNGRCLIPQDTSSEILGNSTSKPCDKDKLFCTRNISDIIFDALGIKISPDTKNQINNISKIAVAAGGISTAAVLASPLLLISYTPNLFFSSIFILFYVKKSKPWGLIYDEETFKPIPFAVISLKNFDTNAFIKDTVSDVNGRFTFTTDKGRYYLEIRAQGYNPILSNKNELDNSIYRGEIISIPKDGLGISVKVPMLKENTGLSFIKKVLSFFRYRLPSFFEHTILITIIFLFIQFFFLSTYLNAFMLIAYSIVYIYILRNKRKYYPSNGFVYDKVLGTAIQGAFVKMYNDKGDLSADLILTDAKGHFDLLANNGMYNLNIEYSSKAPVEFNNQPVANNQINVNYTTKLKMKVGMGDNNLGTNE